MKSKTLIFDIETSYNIVASFSLFPDSIPHQNILKYWHIICFSYKWLGKRAIKCVRAIDDTKTGHRNDKELCKKFSELVEEADTVVYHNGDKFDIKKLRTRTLLQGLPPFNPTRSIDTLKVAKKEFSFVSNRLDGIAKEMGIEGKSKSPNEWWLDALFGQKKAIRELGIYCNRDVELLEEVYLKMRPFVSNHPNHNILYNDGRPRCNKCESDRIVKHQLRMFSTGLRQQYKCSDCGGFCTDGKNIIKNSSDLLR